MLYIFCPALPLHTCLLARTAVRCSERVVDLSAFSLPVLGTAIVGVSTWQASQFRIFVSGFDVLLSFKQQHSNPQIAPTP